MLWGGVRRVRAGMQNRARGDKQPRAFQAALRRVAGPLRRARLAAANRPAPSPQEARRLQARCKTAEPARERQAGPAPSQSRPAFPAPCTAARARPSHGPNVNTASPPGAGVEIDGNAIEWMAAALDAGAPRVSATVRIAGRTVAGSGASIRRVSTPVAKRTQRGGAYFEDAEIYQARIRTSDPSVPSLVPRAMLGPNAEFADVEVVLEQAEPGGPEGAAPPIVLHANLTGAVQRGGATELVLAVTGTEPAAGEGGGG